jgi:hypothetical protein
MAIATIRPARSDQGGEREPNEGAGDPGSHSERFDDFDHSLNQAIEGALDVGGWTAGDRMGELEERLEREVEAAMKNESEMAPRVLDIVEKNIKDAPNASAESGLFSVTPDEITGACRDVLFNGLTEACDGTRVTHDTLPITVIQIGLCMTSYLDDGRPTSIGHRLFRHDMVRKNGDAAAEVLAFIQSRSRKLKPDDNRGVSDMLVRAIMAYGERYLLTEKSKAPWRLGHGTPMPYELLTGSGHGKVIELALDLLPKLLAEHRRFAFVPSDTSDAEIKTIANALRPLQYAVLTNTSYMVDRCINYMEDGREAQSYRGNYRHYKNGLRDLSDDVASNVVVGVYKAGAFAPGGIFYAHEDHVHEAARIVMADSALQEHRGFPNLIDIADRLCRGTFEPSGIAASVNAVFATKGEPFRYLLERATRA